MFLVIVAVVFFFIVTVTVTKVFAKDKEVVNIVLDPMKETADINTDDNIFPKVVQPSKFDELKKKGN